LSAQTPYAEVPLIGFQWDGTEPIYLGFYRGRLGNHRQKRTPCAFDSTTYFPTYTCEFRFSEVSPHLSEDFD